MNNEENKLDKKILLSDEDLKSITGGTYSGLEEFCRMRKTQEECVSNSNRVCYWHVYHGTCMVRTEVLTNV